MPYWNAGIVHVDHVPSGKFAGDFWEGSDCKLLGKFDHDRTLISRTLGIMVFIFGKSSPFMAARFRLVNYYFIYPELCIILCVIMYLCVCMYIRCLCSNFNQFSDLDILFAPDWTRNSRKSYEKPGERQKKQSRSMLVRKSQVLGQWYTITLW